MLGVFILMFSMAALLSVAFRLATRESSKDSSEGKREDVTDSSVFVINTEEAANYSPDEFYTEVAGSFAATIKDLPITTPLERTPIHEIGRQDELTAIDSEPTPEFLENPNPPGLPFEDFDEACTNCFCEDCCGWCGCCCQCDSNDDDDFDDDDDDLCPDCLEELEDCDCFMEDDEICPWCMELEEFCDCEEDFDDDDDDCCSCGDPNCCGF